MDKSQQVLRSPFDIETHKATFINYFEAVILEDGTVEYAVPSHKEKLIKLACEKMGWSREELIKNCPVEYYFDEEVWLTSITNTVSMRNEFYVGEPNRLQIEKILELGEAGIYQGSLDELREQLTQTVSE